MLSHEQLRRFSSEGYLLIPNVLSPTQVAELRSSVRPTFDTQEAHEVGDGAKAIVSLFNRHPELSWLPFHPPVVAALKSILGDDFVLLREVGAHLNFYLGAHKDTTPQERDGHLFHKESDYLMCEAAFYLQDNDARSGGGLDVEPGSHHRPDPLVAGGRESLANKLRRRLTAGPRARYVSVPSRAGDLIIFDFRINHRATPAVEPPATEKMAIFMACSRNNRHVEEYHRFLETRTDGCRYLRGAPHTDQMRARARAAGVNLA